MKTIVLTCCFILFIFSACKKKETCTQSINSGIVITNVVLNSCVIYLKKINSIVINNDSTYRTLLKDTGACTLPEIDFEKFTVLGLYADGGCKVSFDRNVMAFEAEKKYHYKVIANQCGGCYMLVSSCNFVTVPKLPQGWDVTFEVEKVFHN